jgi:transcriptional regulator with XRE-family HTH domain
MAKKRSTGFAVKLRELREAAGLTQVQLAERAGLHLHSLTKLEHGEREPAWSTVLELARALGVEVGVFALSPSAEPPIAPDPKPRGRPAKAAGPGPADKPAAKKQRRRKGE